MANRVLFLTLTVVLAAARVSSAEAQTAQERFWDAAISGDTTQLAATLAAGARIDSLDLRRSPNGRRALNWAAINNGVAVIRFLLAHGAHIEATNLTGFTALHHAAEYGMLEAARALLAAGADPAHRNNEGQKPSERARQEGHTAVAELIEAGERGVAAKP